MSDVRIKAPVVIREVLSASLYHATLPNGKIIRAFVRQSDNIPSLKEGDSYHVLLSPCDFSEGRLVPADLQGVRIVHPVVDGCSGE